MLCSMRYLPLLCLALTGCVEAPTRPTSDPIFGRYSVVNFSDSHCRSFVTSRMDGRDTSVTASATLVPDDSMVERLPMGRYRHRMLVRVYNVEYEPAYEYETDDSVDVPGTRQLSHCLLAIPS